MVRYSIHFAVKRPAKRTLLLPVNNDIVQIMAGLGRIALQSVVWLGRIRL